ncbi:zinc-dependent alcohol dehydrogenase [Angustibacter sp. McL0619]|uniref:zinc-dependent alcohol dehydrogenase n=1 Tax=Angustibacter sp. McL0619 TaxID=3415676 RepID=UPI003CEEFCC9
MKRLLVTGPDQVRVVDAPVPQPGPDDLLVAPLRVGVCATDLELIDGSLVYLRTGELTLPLTPGHEWVGQVVQAGERVTSLAAGDLVVGECSIGCGRCPFCAAGAYHQCPTRRETGIIGLDGALQERMVFPASSAHRVPGGMSLDDAALVEPTAVAFRAFQRLGLPPAASLLIVGGGTQGFLAATMAINLAHADVALLEPRPSRFERLRGVGVRAPTDGETFSHVLEAAGTAQSLSVACERLAPGGTLVVVGLSGRPKVEVAVDTIVVRDQSLVGSIGSPGVWPEVIRLVASGVVRPSALVTHSFDLAEFDDAYDLLRGVDDAVSKVLITPNALPLADG